MQEQNYFTNIRTLKMPKYAAANLRFSPDGRHLVAWSTHRRHAWVWDVENRQVIRKIKKERKRADPRYVYTQDGQYLIGVRSYGKKEPSEFVLYDTKRYKEVDSWQSRYYKSILLSTPDNRVMSYSRWKTGSCLSGEATHV